jgi:hypothetical protein
MLVDFERAILTWKGGSSIGLEKRQNFVAGIRKLVITVHKNLRHEAASGEAANEYTADEEGGFWEPCVDDQQNLAKRLFGDDGVRVMVGGRRVFEAVQIVRAQREGRSKDRVVIHEEAKAETTMEHHLRD